MTKSWNMARNVGLINEKINFLYYIHRAKKKETAGSYPYDDKYRKNGENVSN